jgi:hypothetical protein
VSANGNWLAVNTRFFAMDEFGDTLLRKPVARLGSQLIAAILGRLTPSNEPTTRPSAPRSAPARDRLARGHASVAK